MYIDANILKKAYPYIALMEKGWQIYCTCCEVFG